MAKREVRYFEDYVQGLTVDCGSVEVDEASIIAFARDYDPMPFHVDASAGGLIASGWHTAALAMRQAVDHYLFPESCLSGPGIDELRWPSPVHAGDTLHVRASVLEARRSRSKPDRGIVRSLLEAVNQDDVMVLRLTAINFMLTSQGARESRVGVAAVRGPGRKALAQDERPRGYHKS
jgi:acyl dehydratase